MPAPKVSTAFKTTVAKKTVATTTSATKTASNAKPLVASKAVTKTVAVKPVKKIPAAKPNQISSKVETKIIVSKNLNTEVDAKNFAKAKKVKLVRDSFTIPKPEYLVLDALKLRAGNMKHPVKKGELLRAGIKALAAMTDADLLTALRVVPALKTGRPSK